MLNIVDTEFAELEREELREEGKEGDEDEGGESDDSGDSYESGDEPQRDIIRLLADE